MVDVGKSLKKKRSKPSPLKSRTINDLSQGAFYQILVKHWMDLVFLLLHADEVYKKHTNREDVRILVNY